MASKFLTAIWMVAAAVIVVMAPASQLMRGAQREWAQAAVAAAMFFGLLVTLAVNRAVRGVWLGKGATPRGRWVLALFLVVSGYVTLRPLHILPW